MIGLLRAALLGGALLTTAVPAAAQAATVSYDPSGALLVTAAAGEKNDIGLQPDGAGSDAIVVYEGTGLSLGNPPTGCEAQSTNSFLCTWSPAAGVRVDLGDGNDSGYVSDGLPSGANITINGGSGDDWLAGPAEGPHVTLDGGEGNDKLIGSPGPDHLLGGAGNDILEGRAGPDVLEGQGGDDTLAGDGNCSPAPDVLDGGEGIDTIDQDWTDGSVDNPQPLTLTLGGGADDGRAGEGDEVRNVEHITTYAGSHIVGTDTAEQLTVFQSGEPSIVEGGGGNDVIKTSDGPDRIEGGAGNDTIDAGYGDDVIVGGPGQDVISADLLEGDCGPLWCEYPSGNDQLDVRDGERDSVSCGPGQDIVLADAIDVVASDCETVIRSGAPAPGAPGSAAGRGSSRSGARLAASIATVKLSQALARGLRLRVSAPGAGTVRAQATVGGVVVASGHATAKRAGQITLVARFARSARMRLAHRPKVALIVTVRFTAGASQRSQSRTLTKTLER